MKPAKRLDGVELSLIRQINALATSESLNLGIGEPNVEPDATLRGLAAKAASSGSWHYSANAGNLSLRKKIAERMPTDFDPKTEICITAGTEEGLYAIFRRMSVKAMKCSSRIRDSFRIPHSRRSQAVSRCRTTSSRPIGV